MSIQSTDRVFWPVSQPKLPELMKKRKQKDSMNECMNEYINDCVFFETEQDTKRKREKIDKLQSEKHIERVRRKFKMVISFQQISYF